MIGKPFPRRGRRSVASRATRVCAAAAALTLGVYALASAHAVVYPKASATGAYERYVIRVPNERNVPTTRVAITFPAAVRASSFEEVPGWTLEVVRDSAQRIVGAVWTGSLAPERFVEFPFVAVNPKTAAEVSWPVVQLYANGERVEWSGPAGSKTPASVTTIAPASGAQSSGGWTSWVATAALVLSLVSLGLVLREGGSGRREQVA